MNRWLVPIFVHVIAKLFQELWDHVSAHRLMLAIYDLNIAGPLYTRVGADSLKSLALKAINQRRAKLNGFRSKA